jgi:hypothetical protein
MATHEFRHGHGRTFFHPWVCWTPGDTEANGSNGKGQIRSVPKPSRNAYSKWWKFYGILNMLPRIMGTGVCSSHGFFFRFLVRNVLRFKLDWWSQVIAIPLSWGLSWLIWHSTPVVFFSMRDAVDLKKHPKDETLSDPVLSKKYLDLGKICFPFSQCEIHYNYLENHGTYIL